jgi:cyclase
MRLISRLDIKGPNVIKTVRAEGLRVVGTPQELAERYYEAGVDELVYMDVVASLYGRSLDFEQLKGVCERIFVPLTVGGGIRSLHDIGEALRAGADKVAINTYAIKNPEFITEAAHMYGSQCIVLSIEAKKRDSGWEAYTDGGREHTGIDALEWMQKGIELGAGEVLLTSIDRDGTKEGYDLELVAQAIKRSRVPVIVHGGAGSGADLVAAAALNPSALSVSSLLHYNVSTVQELRQVLQSAGVAVRTPV